MRLVPLAEAVRRDLRLGDDAARILGPVDIDLHGTQAAHRRHAYTVATRIDRTRLAAALGYVAGCSLGCSLGCSVGCSVEGRTVSPMEREHARP